MVNGISLRSVNTFTIVQADDFEDQENTIVDEAQFTNLQDALKVMEKLEAPVKYLKFNHEGFTYKLYPTPEGNEYRVIKQPIVN